MINEIKLNVSEKMEKFGKEKIMIKVICLGLMIGLMLLILDIKEVLQFNFPMHLYTNKELCEIAFKMI